MGNDDPRRMLSRANFGSGRLGTYTMLGVKNYGGSHQLTWGTKNTAYTQGKVVFMTGNTTSATIFVYQDGGDSLADHIGLRLLQ